MYPKMGVSMQETLVTSGHNRLEPLAVSDSFPSSSLSMISSVSAEQSGEDVTNQHTEKIQYQNLSADLSMPKPVWRSFLVKTHLEIFPCPNPSGDIPTRLEIFPL